MVLRDTVLRASLWHTAFHTRLEAALYDPVVTETNANQSVNYFMQITTESI